MKSKLKFILPLVALLVLGGAYKTVLAKPAPKPEKKVEGQVYVLPKEFLLNLANDRYAKLSIALVLPHDAHIGPAEGAKHTVEPPQGFGPLPQEAIVRGIVTDAITGVDADRLVDAEGRELLRRRILKQLDKHTDVHAEDVLFTDVAVQ